MTRLLRRLGGFTASTVLTAVATFASIPLLVGALGPAGWSDLVIGQTIGTFVGVLTAWGWAVVGPATAASTPPDRRLRLLRSSLVARGVLLLPSAAIVAVATPLVVSTHPLEATLSGLAMVVGALGGTWFFVGTGDARRLLALDTLPRAGGVLSGALAVGLGSAVVVAPLLQLVGACVAVVLAVLHARLLSNLKSRDSVRQALARQATGVLTAVASALYVALPLLIVSQIAVAGVPTFALADRLLRYGVLAAAPVSGVAQSWVPADPERLHHRVRIARRLALVWGVLGACAFAALGPVASQLLTGGTVALTVPLLVNYSIAAACILATQVIGPAALIALGRIRALATSTVIGLTAACVLVPLGTVASGPAGAAAGLAVSELLVLCYQMQQSSDGPLGIAKRSPIRPRTRRAAERDAAA